MDYLKKINAEDETEVPAINEPATSTSTGSHQEIQLSQVSQDSFGLPKVPCSDASSDLDVGTPLPISKREIRKTKAAFDLKGLHAIRSQLARQKAVAKANLHSLQV